MTDAEQLIAQAREIHAKAMNCSFLADEGRWRASEDVIDPPLHNYWRVTAIREPRQKGIGPYPVTKALTQEPAVAGLLTFVSTALPQLCDLIERLTVEREEAMKTIDGLGRLGELVIAFTDPSGVLDVAGMKDRIVALERENADLASQVQRFTRVMG